ncbi:MAG: Do family serine endopeptidase [Candidatus Aminicenantes bacterium]|nr:MAG: Do family serine endopeptidase [Candidatus Aminicenantes bacterium]
MKKIGIIAAISFLAGAIFFALTFGYFQRANAPDVPNMVEEQEQETVTTLAPPTVKADTIASGNGDVFNFAPLVKKVRSAVVKVTSESLVQRRRSFFNDDFFDRFFNAPGRGERQRVSGTGSGFFISADGYILTNNHVVKNAIKIKITDINGKEYIAKKIGTDPKSDLALLKIKGKNHPFIRLGDSDKLEVGEWVLAIGNPLEQDLTVTSGIVSAKGRELRGLEVDYQNFIQTDAAINQGNSGGPLINMQGKAIGVNSVILSTSGGNIGIGFAIPSNMARKVIRDLKKEGRVVRGYMGVSITEITDDEAKDFEYPHGGVLIVKVDEDTPAKEAGLKKYDLIFEVNGKKIKSATELRTIIANHSPGDVVRLTIYRKDTKKTVEVKVTEAPDSVKIRSDDEDGTVIDLGMTLRNNSRSLARQYELGTSEGVVVMEVERGGVAYENGLRAGDVIIGVNRDQVESVRQFREIMSGKRSGSRVLMTIVRRDGSENLLRFRIPD